MVYVMYKHERSDSYFVQARDSNAGAAEINARFGGEFKNGVGRFVNCFLF
jgi:hypothetical protein